MATAAAKTGKTATGPVQTGTTSKPGQPSKKRPRLFGWLVILVVTGLGIYLVFRYRLVIKGWFSASNSTGGPTNQKTTELIQGALYNTGGVKNPTPKDVTPTKPPYWPLKKGSKNEHVRWVQIMVNKVPNTGSRITEDGHWGSKTDAKVAAAASYFGLIGLHVTKEEFFTMMCKTWPASDSCKKIETDWITQLSYDW